MVRTAPSRYIIYLLKQSSTDHGYLPKTPKRVLILHPDNIETGEKFGLRHGFKICTEVRYCGGFIGEIKSKHDWLQDLTSK